MPAFLRTVIILTATLMVGAACWGGDDGSKSTPNADSTASGTEVTREKDGVRLTISIDKGDYEGGETVNARAVVKNTTDDPITYTIQAGTTEPLYFVVSSEINGEQPLLQEADEGTSVAGGGTGTLEGGEELTEEVSWDGMIDIYQTPVQAPTGRYAIAAQFAIGEHTAGAQPVPLTATVGFNVEGGDPIITPQEAIKKAVLTPEVQAWLEPRSHTLLCALNARGLFYNVNTTTGEPFETFDLLYQNQITDGLPICSPVTEDDTWRVIFSSREGSEPNRVSAFLDLNDGSLVRFEEVGPEPPPPSPAPSPVISPISGG